MSPERCDTAQPSERPDIMTIRHIATALAALLMTLTTTTAASANDSYSCQDTSLAKPTTVRIYGGEVTDAHTAPWQVYLEINTPTQSFMCGGSLIARGWVLTAAHCVEQLATGMGGTGNGSIRAFHGSLRRGEGPSRAGRAVFIHKAYNSDSLDADIALVQLDSPFETSLRNLIHYRASEKDPENQARLTKAGNCAMVSGWGTMENGHTSEVLRHTRVPLVSNEACRAAYRSLTENMICAGYEAGGRDSCQGDSGGPLVVFNGPAGPELVGVVSHGNGCAKPRYYGVYTRVSRFESWISKCIENPGLCETR
jgi:secreted trypsin-like serine protease